VIVRWSSYKCILYLIVIIDVDASFLKCFIKQVLIRRVHVALPLYFRFLVDNTTVIVDVYLLSLYVLLNVTVLNSIPFIAVVSSFYVFYVS